MAGRILVSACLMGAPVRYDGSARTLLDATLARWQAEGLLVPLCPELAGGLPTPRPPAEIAAGQDGGDVLAGHARIIEKSGADVTAAYHAGAAAALALAREAGCTDALLMDGSPSCGSGFIHAGRFDGTTRPGMGLTAALLARSGIRVWSHRDLALLVAARTA